MRYLRRLPPLLRVASLVGLLFLLAGFGLFINSLIMSLLSPPRDMYQGLRRGMVIGGNLFLLGLACFYAIRIYTNRFRRPDRRPFPLGSWQSQVRVIALLSVLPLAGIALAFIISLAGDTLLIVLAVFYLAGFVFLVYSWQIAGPQNRGPMRTPPAG